MAAKRLQRCLCSPPHFFTSIVFLLQVILGSGPMHKQPPPDKGDFQDMKTSPCQAKFGSLEVPWSKHACTLPAKQSRERGTENACGNQDASGCKSDQQNKKKICDVEVYCCSSWRLWKLATSAQTFLTRPLANSAILHCHEWKCAVTRLPAAARPCFCASTKPGLAKHVVMT